MYEYFHVKVAANASILGGFSLDPEYRNIIDRAAEEGWRYVTSADRTPEVRLRIIAAFHTLY